MMLRAARQLLQVRFEPIQPLVELVDDCGFADVVLRSQLPLRFSGGIHLVRRKYVIEV